MLPLDDLSSLALFAQVVRLRSFSAAARECKIAKSAVSRRVARLEDRFGVRLLRRSTRAVSVTEEGLRVYEHCAALLAAAAAAERAAGAAAEGVRGTLRINAPVTFAQMHLAAAVASFLAQQPGVDVSLSTDDPIVDIVEGGFDVTIRIGRLRDSALVARKLATDRLVICASPAYLARKGEPVTPADLLRHNCLHYTLVPRDAEWRFRGKDGPLSVPARGNFEAGNGTVLHRAALEGLGLAVLPSFMVAQDVAAGRLALVLEGQRRAEIGIYAVVTHRRQMPPRVRAFLDFLSGYFREFARETIPKLSQARPVRRR